MTKLYVTLFVLFLTTASAFAQHENATKILGCWTLEKLEFSEPMQGSDKVSAEAKGTKICFDKSGTFTNGKAGSDAVQKGTYSISEDGKTIHQKTQNDDPYTQDIPGTIIVLDANKLQIKAEEITLYFTKS